MIRFIRIAAVVGAVWSLLATGALCLFGALMSLTDRFNDPHAALLGIVVAEICLLVALAQTFRARAWTAIPLLIWFVAASGLLSYKSGLHEWPGDLAGLTIVLAPVTVTMILAAAQGISVRPPGHS